MKTQLDTAIIAMKMSEQSIYTRSTTGREEPLLDDQIIFIIKMFKQN